MTTHFEINAAPFTAALALVAALVLGGLGGYAIGTTVRAPAAVPLPVAIPVKGQIAPQPPATQPLGSPPIFEEGRMCTADFTVCREPQNSYD
jgi:hypothetical protein